MVKPPAVELTAATELSVIAWPCREVLEVFLDELCLIPPAWLFPGELPPTTLGEVAARSGLDLAEVISRIKVVLRMSDGLEIAPEELQAMLSSNSGELPLLIDVREDWEFAVGHLPGSILLASVDFKTLLPTMQKAACVVAICHHGVRSYSAALYLRQHGVTHARSLIGGTDLWAQRIDPAMARY